MSKFLKNEFILRNQGFFNNNFKQKLSWERVMRIKDSVKIKKLSTCIKNIY